MLIDHPPMVLVLLHFLGGSASEWKGVIAALPAGFEAMPVDLPGFGDAPEGAGYGVSAMADHVVEAIRSRATGSFSIVGHSMGAKVAAVVARRAEDGAAGLAGLSHLVLVAGSPPGPEPMEDAKRAAMLSWFQGDAASSRRQAEGFIDANTHLPLAPPLRDAAVADVLRARRSAWTAWLGGGSREDWTSRIGRLATPTLVIAGENDEALGPAAQRVATLPHFSDVEIAVVPGGAHLLPIEHPAAVAALIASHIDVRSASIPAPYRALIQSSRVSEGTRRTLLARAAPAQSAPRVLSEQALAVLRAVARRIIPLDSAPARDVAGRIDQVLAEAQGDGWRYAALPPDLDAAEGGARTLDAAAGHGGFASREAAAQDDLLHRVADGRLDVAGDGLLSADQMRLWFTDLRSAVTRAYVAHPATLARMGYSGIANGGDGPRKLTRTMISAGERELWEPVAAPAS